MHNFPYLCGMKQKTAIYHLFALFTVIVWGTTFVSTKVLLTCGLSPVGIFLYRFALAYVCLLAVARGRLLADRWIDELLLCLAGICGGSLYFISENTALETTQASNVSLLVSTSPLFTLLLARLFYRERLPRRIFWGSCLALAGVGMVVFAGEGVRAGRLSGDLLALLAAVVWACYCMLLKRLDTRYSTLFITRKVFFYGIASLALYACFFPIPTDFGLLRQPVVYLNLLFLGVLASMGCYLMWNAAVRVLGAPRTANYVYIIPLVTLLFSAIFLGEQLTPLSLAGTVCIIGGVYWAAR